MAIRKALEVVRILCARTLLGASGSDRSADQSVALDQRNSSDQKHTKLAELMAPVRRLLACPERFPVGTLQMPEFFNKKKVIR